MLLEALKPPSITTPTSCEFLFCKAHARLLVPTFCSQIWSRLHRPTSRSRPPSLLLRNALRRTLVIAITRSAQNHWFVRVLSIQLRRAATQILIVIHCCRRSPSAPTRTRLVSSAQWDGPRPCKMSRRLMRRTRQRRSTAVRRRFHLPILGCHSPLSQIFERG